MTEIWRLVQRIKDYSKCAITEPCRLDPGSSWPLLSHISSHDEEAGPLVKVATDDA